MSSMRPKGCLDLVIKGGAFIAYGPEKIVRSIRLGPAWQSWTKPYTSFGAFGSRYGKMRPDDYFARGGRTGGRCELPGKR